MKIITTPDPRLREKSEKVLRIDDEVRELIEGMRQLSLEWEKEHPYEISAAMAAPQVGVLKRVIVLRDDTDDKEKATFTALINPVVVKTEGKLLKDYEGCLSVPDLYGEVKRPSKVRIKAKLEDGQEVRIRAKGEMARTLLHEIDHLDGILFIDHVKGNPKGFFRMNEQGELDQIGEEEYEREIRDNPQLWGE